ncbi:hypothetical protein Zmor_010155 [Zophobas morio]|uniref:Uncharacterized protein n=1 Tax=Zophobas morio TaxID=2755281 RepID=A0AA38MJN2_9CUCU|nr:hypothetical protein Zmor_010155 [Zophobas morio]
MWSLGGVAALTNILAHQPKIGCVLHILLLSNTSRLLTQGLGDPLYAALTSRQRNALHRVRVGSVTSGNSALAHSLTPSCRFSENTKNKKPAFVPSLTISKSADH